ncbi:MAG TPA: carboxylesterase family protein [Streptosporangiaceae bacterium]|nr:carboxylesterase family protein [Streptosporangiaceae bacterium]
MRLIRRPKKAIWTKLAAVTALAVGLAWPAASAAAAPHARAQTAAAPACTDGTTVTTNSGPVCGTTASAVTSYLGIPYAAPPVGSLRWASPAPAAPWTTTLQATAAGPTCVAPGSGSENCLTLNVQVPADAGPGSHLPVMVEIHGGGFLLFGPPDGSHLVTAGHVIYVGMNYRLGILGFMALKGLGPHSGDYGLQDQQAALRWVQQNIASFGGNPHNVTIFGQSAGGASVCEQAVSPTARGLFQKGISQSGFYNSAVGPNQVWEAADCKSQLPTEAQAQAAGAALASKVGCGNAADQVACMRAVPAATLASNAGQVLDPGAGGTIAPTINGTTLPMSPGRAFATGHVNDVSLAIGVDRDEINGGVNTPTTTAHTPDQYQSLVQAKYGTLAPKVFALYPLSRFSTPFIAFRTIEADSDSVCPALAADRRIASHTVNFAWENDDSDSPNTFLSGADPNGSFHDAENAFLFPGSATLDADQAALAVQVTSQWTGYAATGSPSVTGTPLWTAYSHHSPEVMSLVPAGDSVMVPARTLAAQHNCGLWDSVTPIPAS